MKKMVTSILVCGLAQSSCVNAVSFNKENFGFTLAGAAFTGAGYFIYNKVTHKNEKCLFAKDVLVSIKAKYDGDISQMSLDAIKDDLHVLAESCGDAYLDIKGREEKKTLLEIIQKRTYELGELERITQRRQIVNEHIQLMKVRYKNEFESADTGKITKAQFERFAFENYGGINATPVSLYCKNLQFDEDALLAINVDDLSAENRAWYQDALINLPSIHKFVNAELYEQIQQEQEKHRKLQYEHQMREQEYQLKRKEIECKELKKKSIIHRDQKMTDLAASVEQSSKVSQEQSERILDMLNRMEDQHGGMTRQLKHVKIAINESKNDSEKRDIDVNSKLAYIVQWISEYNAWLHQQAAANNSHHHNQAASSAPWMNQ